jgi:FkbM family methyltransferase
VILADALNHQNMASHWPGNGCDANPLSSTRARLICGRRPSDAHHLRFTQSRALNGKVSDEFTVPLCRGHHREVHRSGDEAAWWTTAGIDPTVVARALWLETHPLPKISDKTAPRRRPNRQYRQQQRSKKGDAPFLDVLRGGERSKGATKAMTLRELIFGIVSRLPQRLRHWLYGQSWLRTRLAPILKHSVPAHGAVVVTVATGPLRGMKLAVDRNTPNYYWLDDRYEAEAVAVLHEHAKPAAVVADIGAHIGFDTLLLSRLVGGSGTVLSFEPDATNLTQLRQNLKINSITNVRVIDRAVSESTGTCYFDAQGLTTSCLLSAEPLGEAMRVQTVSLDDLFYNEHAPMPSFLKIDVEGHELAVLRSEDLFNPCGIGCGS